MSDFLDLSSLGGKKDAPPSKKAPGRKPSGGKSRRGLIAGAVLAAIAIAAVAVFVLGGDDEESESNETATTPAEYCALVAEFDRLAPNPDPQAEGVDTSPEAVRGQLDQLSVTINRLQADAPADIRPDVTAAVAALEDAAAGTTAAIQTTAYRESRERLTSFRSTTCSSDVGTVGD